MVKARHLVRRLGAQIPENSQRVFGHYFRCFLKLFAAAGCERLSELNRTMINKKINDKIESYSVFYPSVATGAYLKEERVAP